MKYLGNPSSGSRANETYSRNRFGQYTRTRAIPVQPRTPKQVEIRALLSTASKQWALLDETVREQWRAWANNHTISDSLGQKNYKTGHQAFVSAYVIAKLSAVDLPIVPPEEWIPPIGCITRMEYTGTATITPPEVDDFIFVYASGVYGYGVNFFSRFNLICVLGSGVVSPYSFKTHWEQVYGAWPTYGRICFRSRYCKKGVDLGPVESLILDTKPTPP